MLLWQNSVSAQQREKEQNKQRLDLFKAMIPQTSTQNYDHMDNVWLAITLGTLKAVIFQYTRTVSKPIMKHQIFNKHITQYRKYLQKKNEEEKDIQWNKRTSLQSVLSCNYLDILEVHCCMKG